MRDIQYFPTQGWAGTAFCTRKRSETYSINKINLIFKNTPESWERKTFTFAGSKIQRMCLRTLWYSYHKCKIAHIFIICGSRNGLYLFENEDFYGPDSIFGLMQINARVQKSYRTHRHQFQFKNFSGSRRIFWPTGCFVRVTTRQYRTHFYYNLWYQYRKKLSNSRNTAFLDSLSNSQNTYIQNAYNLEKNHQTNKDQSVKGRNVITFILLQ